MSYSFSVKAATKAEALKMLSEQFDGVLTAQPVHAVDMPVARQATESFVNLAADDPNCDIGVSVSGSVYVPAEGLRQASISINVGFNPPRT